jgi:hypothetical protein
MSTSPICSHTRARLYRLCCGCVAGVSRCKLRQRRHSILSPRTWTRRQSRQQRVDAPRPCKLYLALALIQCKRPKYLSSAKVTQLTAKTGPSCPCCQIRSERLYHGRQGPGFPVKSDENGWIPRSAVSGLQVVKWWRPSATDVRVYVGPYSRHGVAAFAIGSCEILAMRPKLDDRIL